VDYFSRLAISNSSVDVPLTISRDALLTYLDAHADDPAGELTKLTNGIRKLAGLLIAQDDGYDSQVKAQDLLYGHNFAEGFGGSIWHYDGRADAGHGPPTPTATEAETLHQLNEAQAILDATSRELDLKRWTLFAHWWNLVQDPLTNLVTPQAVKDHDALETLVKGLCDEINVLYARQQAKQNFITATTNLDSTGKEITIKGQPTPTRQPYKRTTKPPFYIRKDPTVCIAGMASGWPANFSDPLICRVATQLVPGPSPSTSPAISSLYLKIPKDLGTLRQLAQNLVAEFLVRPDPTSKDPNQQQRQSAPGWKPWNDTQPWFPSVIIFLCSITLALIIYRLYVEWEALYIHLEREKWHVETFNSGVPVHEMVRYKIDEDLNADPNNQKDQRIISGRTLVLPQQIFSLKSMLAALPITKEVRDTYGLNEEEVSALHDKIDQMQYISCPLSGLTNHLLTLVEGSHVKPLARTSSDGDPVPLSAAADATVIVTNPRTNPIFDTERLKLIKTQSALTPYGNLVGFPSESNSPAGFKAATHGQVMFTKFNIIDKFGQAVCAITPTPIPVKPKFPPPSVYPCISDYFAPGALENPKGPPKYLPNVIYRDQDPITRPSTIADPKQPPVPLTTTGEEALSRFFQLNPSINQDTRLNASYVRPDPLGSKAFVPVNDWV
jgi:hypothetical protein